MPNFWLGDDWRLWRKNGVLWSQVECIDGLSIGFDREIVEMPLRGDKRIGGKPGKPKIPLTFQLRYSDTDADAVAIRDAALSETSIIFRIVLDGSADEEGNEYFTDDFYIGGFPLSMNLSEGAIFEITLTPAIDYDASVASNLAAVVTP